MRNPALFVALEDLLDSNDDLSANAIRLLSDFHAHGYPIVGLCSQSGLDCGPLGPTARMRRVLRERSGAQFAAVVVLENAYSPRPLWECARRFGLSLEYSLFLTDGPHSGVALTAGIRQLKSCTLALHERYSAA